MNILNKGVVAPTRLHKKAETDTPNQIAIVLRKCLDVLSPQEKNEPTLFDQNPRAATVFLVDELTKALNLIADFKYIK